MLELQKFSYKKNKLMKIQYLMFFPNFEKNKMFLS
uniref:Uncharacterized protein n=1 Tax=Arundo donax TaxID=35708 RepID=A0A0A8ZDI9_ARUDO